MAGSATTSFPSATSSSTQLPLLSGPTQQLIPASNTDYLTRYSQDGSLRIQISKHDVDQLSEIDLLHLATNTAQFILNTTHPLLYIAHKLTTNPQSHLEIFYRHTTASGLCTLLALQQLQTRHTMHYSDQYPSCLELPQQKDVLIQFIEDLISWSSTINNPDIPRLQHIITVLEGDGTSLDSSHWFGLENIHLFNIPFPVTCWSSNGQSPDYLILAYTNQLGPTYNHLGQHALCFSQYLQLYVTPNVMHQHSLHFYSVPNLQILSAREQRLQEVLLSLVPDIQVYIRSRQMLPLVPTIRHNNTINSTIRSYFSSPYGTQHSILMTCPSDLDRIHNIVRASLLQTGPSLQLTSYARASFAQLTLIPLLITQDDNAPTTDSSGYCGYDLAGQAFTQDVLRRQNRKQILLSIHTLLPELTLDELQTWFQRIIQYGLPRRGFNLRNIRQRADFKIWIRILIAWSKTTETAGHLTRVLQHLNTSAQPSVLPRSSNLWCTTNILMDLNLPFDFICLGTESSRPGQPILDSTYKKLIIIKYKHYKNLTYQTQPNICDILKCPNIGIFSNDHFFLANNATIDTRAVIRELQSEYEQLLTVIMIARDVNPTNHSSVIHIDQDDHLNIPHSPDIVDVITPTQSAVSSSAPSVNSDNSSEDSHNKNASPPCSPPQRSIDTFLCVSGPDYDIVGLRAAVSVDPFFKQKESQQILKQNLLAGIRLHPDIYPSPIIRECIQHIFTRTTVKDSSLSGKGLFPILRANILPGEVVSIYTGSPTTRRNPYTMLIAPNYEIGNIPIMGDTYAKAPYINENISAPHKNNCKLIYPGIVIATRPIHHTDEICMTYGTEYDWSHVKETYKSTLIDAIIVMMIKFLPSGPPEVDIRNTYDQLLKGPQAAQFHLLLDHFFSGTRDAPHPQLVLHDNVPVYEDNISTWIEMLLTCRWFYSQQCFRQYGCSERTLQGFQTVELPTGTRKSSRLAMKPRVSMAGMCIDSTPNKFMLHSPPLIPFTPKYLISTTMEVSSTAAEHTQCLGEDDVFTKSVTAPQTSVPTQHSKTHDPIDGHTAAYINPSKAAPNPHLRNYTSITYQTDSDHIDRLEQLANEMFPIRQHNHPPTNLLTVAVYNIGSSLEEKRSEIYSVIPSKHIDVTVLLDCHVTTTNLHTYKNHMKLNIKKGYRFFAFPTQPTDTSPNLIGGTVVILSSRLQHFQSIQLIPLGSLVHLTFRFDTQSVSIFACYIPQKNHHTESLQTRISNIMDVPEGHTVHSVIHEVLQTSVLRAQEKQEVVIVMGDFNKNISSLDSSGDFQYLHTKLQLQHAANTTELQQSSYVMGERQTRIDFTLFSGEASPIRSNCITLDHFTSDHKPIVTSFRIHNASRPFEHLLTKPGVPKYDHSNASSRADFEREVGKIPHYPDETPANRIRCITNDTVHIASVLRSIKKSHRGHRVSDWCPENHSLSLCLKNVIKINRHVHGLHKYTKWTTSTYGLALQRVRDQWVKDINKITDVPVKRDELRQLGGYGPDFWTGRTLSELTLHTTDAIPVIRTLLRSRLKKQRHEQWKHFRQTREFQFQLQQIGRPIQSVLRNSSKERVPLLLEELKIDDTIHLQPGYIHHQLTEFFKKWMSSANKLSPETWQQNLSDADAFSQLTSSLNIPTAQSQTLWAAIQKRPEPSAKLTAIQRELTRTPTYEEYRTQVNLASLHSAGGMSGMTYSMMKAWSEEIHHIVYDDLVKLWNDKEIPPEWAWRWLLPIPKKPDPSMPDLRPLCLLEVVRKLWSKIFVQRINTTAQQHQWLHQGQHSGKGKGTESAVLEFTATLETAKELRVPLFLSSWDIKRAFDSVDRSILLFSWTRIGVPIELALYLVSMDIDAIMVVQTPLAMNILSEYGYAGLQDYDIPFHQERGTAQGGVDSSFVFTAFLDILLCAIQIQSCDVEQFYISDIDGNLQPSLPIGYVDDLICTTPTYDSLQTTADLVSAFCILFQLDLNTTKFRAFSVIWGNPNKDIPNQITIHTKGWIAVPVDISLDGTMVHLGVTWDMSLDNQTLFTQTKAALQQHLHNIVHSKASQAIKLTAIKVALISQLVYATKFAPWPLQSYQELDVLLNVAYRSISLNRSSFPTDLLYLPTSSLGLGYTQFSEQVQLAKLHMFQRSTYGSSRQRQFIMNSLTSRVIRQMGCQPPRYGSYKLTMLPKTCLLTEDKEYSWWFTSLAQHLENADLSIQRDNMATVPLISHITADIRRNPQHNRILIAKGLVTPLELNMEGDTDQELTTLGITWSESYMTPVSPLPLRQGQVWCKHDAEAQHHIVIEIAGFSNDNLYYYPWSVEQLTKHGTPKSVRLYNSPRVLLGAGSSHSMPICSFFDGSHSTFSLVTLGPEKYVGVDHVATCLAIRTREPLIPQPILLSNEIHPWFQDVQSMLSIHTVAEEQGSILDLLIDTQTSHAKSVIVRQRHDEAPHALLINHDFLSRPTLVSAQAVTLHIAAAMSASDQQTYACTNKAGITYHRQCSNKPVANPLVPILQPQQARRMFPMRANTPEQNKLLKKVRKQPHKLISIPGRQNDVDMETQVYMTRVLPNLGNLPTGTLENVTVVNDSDLIQNCRLRSHGCICYTANSKPCLEDYTEILSTVRLRRYLEQRDNYRRSVQVTLGEPASVEPYWAGSTMRLAADIIKRVPQGSGRSFIVRVILDWHLTGRNKAKCTSDIQDGICPHCPGQQENQEHILCHCSHPLMVAVRAAHSHTMSIALAEAPVYIKEFHKIAMKPANHELLVGRVHLHHLHSLSRLPMVSQGSKVKSTYHQLVVHCKHYMALAISLYNMRQHIINAEHNPPTPTHPAPSPERLRVEAYEMLNGVMPYHHLYSDGTKIVKLDDLTKLQEPITIGYKREILTSANSTILSTEEKAREKRQKVIEDQMKAAEEKARKAHFRRLTTLIRPQDEQAWKEMYQPSPSQPTAPTAPDDSSAEEQRLQKQKDKLEDYLLLMNDKFPFGVSATSTHITTEHSTSPQSPHSNQLEITPLVNQDNPGDSAINTTNLRVLVEEEPAIVVPNITTTITTSTSKSHTSTTKRPNKLNSHQRFRGNQRRQNLLNWLNTWTKTSSTHNITTPTNTGNTESNNVNNVNTHHNTVNNAHLDNHSSIVITNNISNSPTVHYHNHNDSKRLNSNLIIPTTNTNDHDNHQSIKYHKGVSNNNKRSNISRSSSSSCSSNSSSGLNSSSNKTLIKQPTSHTCTRLVTDWLHVHHPTTSPLSDNLTVHLASPTQTRSSSSLSRETTGLSRCSNSHPPTVSQHESHKRKLLPSDFPPTSPLAVHPDYKRARSAPGSPQGSADPG